MTAVGVALAGWLIAWTLSQPSGGPPVVARAPAPTAVAGDGSLKTLNDSAVDEGQVRVAWEGGLEESWRQRFEAAFDREFGFHVALSIASDNSGAPTAGQQPPWDVRIGGVWTAAEAAQAGWLSPHNWTGLFGAPSQAVLFDGGAVTFAQQRLLPAYNTRRVDAAAAPATWDALAAGRWKGRLGISSQTEVWADLSSSWGDERTTALVRALAGQNPVRGTEAELEQKLEAGAIDLVAALDERLVLAARNRAAAVSLAPVQPQVLRSWAASPIRGAAHSHAALLFAGFLLTQEGQRLWRDYAGGSSIYLPDSPYQDTSSGQSYVLANQDFVTRDLPARTAKYAKLLGF